MDTVTNSKAIVVHTPIPDWVFHKVFSKKKQVFPDCAYSQLDLKRMFKQGFIKKDV